jgi:hypothetical protein
MGGRDLTGRSAEDTTVNRLLGQYGLRVPVAVVAVVVLFQAALILALTVQHEVGTVTRTISTATMTLPAVVWTILGLALGLFDGWQIHERRLMQRLARIAGHGLLGALVGATAGGIAIVGGILVLLLLGLFLERVGSLF